MSTSERVEREERKILLSQSSRRQVRPWKESYGESQEEELHRELNWRRIGDKDDGDHGCDHDGWGNELNFGVHAEFNRDSPSSVDDRLHWHPCCQHELQSFVRHWLCRRYDAGHWERRQRHRY
jgi:hypothetical protein